MIYKNCATYRQINIYPDDLNEYCFKYIYNPVVLRLPQVRDLNNTVASVMPISLLPALYVFKAPA